MMPSRTSKVRFSLGEIKITLLEMFDDIERVEIVIEPFAESAHAQVELFFSGVTKRRMPDVMHQR